MPKPSDATLIRRSLAGDKEAFVELVKHYEQPLAALIRYQIGDLHHAEDVLQETLFQAWAGLYRLRDPSKFRAWLLQVARNRCRDFEKSPQRRNRPTEERKLVALLNRFGRAIAKADSKVAEVADALEQVPSAERQVARLFYLKGLTISEIAKRSRCPEGTVKRRLFEARRHLREALGVPSRKSKKEKDYE